MRFYWYPLWVLALITYFSLSGQASYSASIDVQEYHVKVTYLLRFNKFVTYPENRFSSPHSPIHICVLGDDPFQNSLDTAAKSETAQYRSFNVSYLQNLEEVNICHTLFISSSEKDQLPTILSHIKSQPILTVSDMENFVTRGGMIQFYILDNSVRFMIDLTTVQEANLIISSHMLSVAKVVKAH